VTPVIVELMISGSKYNPQAADDVIKKLQKDKEGTIKQLKDKLLLPLKGRTAAIANMAKLNGFLMEAF
jgi:hypothetical protein